MTKFAEIKKFSEDYMEKNKAELDAISAMEYEEIRVEYDNENKLINVYIKNERQKRFDRLVENLQKELKHRFFAK
jgi:DNA-binding transcriptional regulator YbjK